MEQRESVSRGSLADYLSWNLLEQRSENYNKIQKHIESHIIKTIEDLVVEGRITSSDERTALEGIAKGVAKELNRDRNKLIKLN